MKIEKILEYPNKLKKQTYLGVAILRDSRVRSIETFCIYNEPTHLPHLQFDIRLYSVQVGKIEDDKFIDIQTGMFSLYGKENILSYFNDNTRYCIVSKTFIFNTKIVNHPTSITDNYADWLNSMLISSPEEELNKIINNCNQHQ
jgi:hypothetical protein